MIKKDNLEVSNKEIKNKQLVLEEAKDLEKLPLSKFLYMMISFSIMLVILIIKNNYLKKYESFDF